MNSVGITSAGGAGMAIATWIDQGYPEADLWPVDVRRYNKWQNNLKYIEERVNVESVGNLYTDHWPFKQPTSSRNVLKTPIHDRLRILVPVLEWFRAGNVPTGLPQKE